MRFLHSDNRNSSSVTVVIITLFAVSISLIPAGCGESDTVPIGNSKARVSVPVKSDTASLISSLPEGENGPAESGKHDIISKDDPVQNEHTLLELSQDPIYLIEGELPSNQALTPEKSPFGFHPASTDSSNYDYAREIGVDWDRSRLYFFWVLVQPDLSSEKYEWEMYDRYFQALPEGFMALSNITVAPYSAVVRPGTTQQGNRLTENIDTSLYLEGTTYRPSNPEAYSKWVEAVVERYDGDGIQDMPGLKNGVKYWQVDNEPPREREGYPDLVRITSEAIKKADPDAGILIGGLSAPYGQMAQIYEESCLPIIENLNGEGIDILDIHFFGQAGDWKYIPDMVARAKQDLAGNGFSDTPIWFTEMGTYSGSPTDRGGRRLPAQSEREQASEMVKRYATALGSGVEKIFWAWGMVEGFLMNGYADTTNNNFFDNTGFVYDGLGPDDPGEGTKKFIYWSYQNMTDLLNYWDGSPPENLEIADGVNAYRFRFGTDDGRGIVVLWLDDTK